MKKLEIFMVFLSFPLSLCTQISASLWGFVFSRHCNVTLPRWKERGSLPFSLSFTHTHTHTDSSAYRHIHTVFRSKEVTVQSTNRKNLNHKCFFFIYVTGNEYVSFIKPSECILSISNETEAIEKERGKSRIIDSDREKNYWL